MCVHGLNISDCSGSPQIAAEAPDFILLGKIMNTALSVGGGRPGASHTLFKVYFYLLFMCMTLCALAEARESIISSCPGVTGSCELPAEHDGN